MAVVFAYLSVIFVWSTTPLAIQWSSEGLSFMAAVLARMSLAFFVGLFIYKLLGRQLFSHPSIWKTYFLGAIGIFPNMPVVYWSAQYIPSGLIAVVYGVSPFITGLMSYWLLKENPFTAKRVFALLLAALGLVIIFYDQLHVGTKAVLGVLGVVLSAFMMALSGVSLKKASIPCNAFQQTLGSLLFALPGLLLMWYLIDGRPPSSVTTKASMAVIYLAVFGSLVGFTLYFFVLKNMSATAVSLITLVTPVLAMVWGQLFAHEVLGWSLILGAGCVILALLVYMDLIKLVTNGALLRGAWHQDSLNAIKSDYVRWK